MTSKLIFNIIILYLAVILPGYVYGANFVGEVHLNKVTLEDVIIIGDAELEQVKAKSLSITGGFDFKDLILADSFELNGDGDGDGLKCKKLTGNGFLSAKNVKVNGPLKFTGSLEMKNSDLKDIQISGELILNNCKADNILIDDDKLMKAATVVLKNKTVISGDIYFKSGNGEVQIDEHVVLLGSIKGARIVRK